MSVWAGVDVGGRRKGFHAAAIDETGIVAGPEALPSVEECAGWVCELAPALVAVDSPIAPAPDGLRLRESERKLRSAVCGIRWTPWEEALTGNDAYYGWVLHGLELYDALARAGLRTVECFPTASWTRWFGPRGRRTRAAWTRDGLERLDLARLPARTNQDVRDSIAAALTARLHAEGRTVCYGEIVVPAKRFSRPPRSVDHARRHRGGSAA